MKEGVYIQTGCFFGNEKEFLNRVKNTNSDKRYLKLIRFIKANLIENEK